MSNDSSTNSAATLEELADLFVGRFRAGERPSIEDFASGHPLFAEELRELLPTLVMLEQHAPAENTAAFATGGGLSPGTPREIGDFAIVREIGRGGMGVVYEAVQQSLGRHVALKVLSSAGLLNSSHLERFRLEARAAARLHHTHIVPVFGVGEHEGLHYYAMQFIPGQSLDLVFHALRDLRANGTTRTAAPVNSLSRLAASGILSGNIFLRSDVEPASALTDARQPKGEIIPADPRSTEKTPNNLTSTQLSTSHSGRELYRSVARVGLQVAEALGYAHSEGILHRDIKPSNLLLDAKGNVWITDFGLAKAEDTDGLTQTGDFVGTLRYMAPERLEGWSDRRSDIYGLGVTLYELVALTPFFESTTRGHLIDRILHDTPVSPSKIDRSIPRDLETIVLKAIAKEPSSRYHSAEEMAEDLRRFLADRPIKSRRATATEQFIRWCRRNPMVAGLLAAVVTVLTLGIITSSYYAASASHQAHAAAASLAEAQTQKKRTELVNDFLLDEVFGLADPNVFKRSGIPLIEALDRAAGRIDTRMADDPQLRAILQERMGGIYSSLGRYDQATEQYEKALPLWQELAGRRDPHTLKCASDLGFALFKVGRLDDARNLLQETFDAQTQVLGAESPDTIQTDISLGLMMMSAMDPDVVEHVRKTYEHAVAALGPKHRLTYRAESTFSWALRWQRDYPQALQLADAALPGLRETLGSEDVDTLFAMHNHALCLFELERIKESTDELSALLTLRRRVLGSTQVDTMWTLYWLMRAESSAGDLAKVKDCSRELASYVDDAQCNDAYLIDFAASWFATVGPQEVRNSKLAVKLANKACDMTHYSRGDLVSTLSIAYSVDGNCPATVESSIKSVGVAPYSANRHFDAAVRCLSCGDLNAYRQVSLATWQRYAKARNPIEQFWAVWTCCLAPDAIDDLDSALRVATRLRVESPDQLSYAAAEGLIMYRCGKFSDAIQFAIPLLDSPSKVKSNSHYRSYLRYMLTMAHWRLGDYDQARTDLRLAKQFEDEVAKHRLSWSQETSLAQIRQEAELLIKPAELGDHSE